MARRARIGRRAAGLGAGAACGVVALAGTAFACMCPLVGTMVVTALTGPHPGSMSATVGQGPTSSMAFCSTLDSGGFHDGIHEGRHSPVAAGPHGPGATLEEGNQLHIAVAPASCSNGPAADVAAAQAVIDHVAENGINTTPLGLLGVTMNNLGNSFANSLNPNAEPFNDDGSLNTNPADVILADINFRSGVFNTPVPSPDPGFTTYTFGAYEFRGCVNDPASNLPDANLQSAYMPVLPGGVGTAVVTVPSGFIEPDDTAGVCVHAMTNTSELNGRVISQISMAPLTVV